MVVKQEIVDYAKQMSAQGYSEDKIKKQLIEAGWDEADINDSLLQEMKEDSPVKTTSEDKNQPEAASKVEATNTHYAGFWIRVLAYLIDGMIVGTVNFIIGFVIALIFFMGNPMASDISNALTFLVYGIGLVIGLLYFALMESSKSQGTLGKMACGIKVVDKEMQRITFGRAIGRYLAKIISGIAMIGYIMVGFMEKKTGLHDLIAGTYVIYKK